ncbi:hypothetical protein AYK25_06850 [Thermoplasmatales archaeon SM1-50]|nr:MAG: hypothetical protein AYK25_06850 [Thermoplasmatales archaeon SM1-50]
MNRRLGSKLQSGILNCLNDERVDSVPGIKIRQTYTIIDYLLEEGYIKRPDKRRKNYEKKCKQIHIQVCRAIRNLARDEPDKGIKPIIKVKRKVCFGQRKETFSYRLGYRKKTKKEHYYSIWFQYIYPVDFELSEEEY